MNHAEYDALLEQTLADRRLTGGERDALAGWVRDHVRTDGDRGTARVRAFEVAREAVGEGDGRRVLTWLEDVLRVVAPVAAAPAEVAPAEVCFSPGAECLNRIVGRFTAARRSADVCVFTITDDRIARAVLDAHRRGVRVRVVTDDDKAGDLGSDVARLADAGVPVRIDRSPYHMHHKFALFDGARVLNGSYNWTRGAAEQNEENLVDTGDPRVVAAFARQFEALWAKLA